MSSIKSIKSISPIKAPQTQSPQTKAPTSPSLPRGLPARLALMMLMQYFVLGAFWPILTLYLKDCLNFSGAQIGTVLASSAVAAFVSPLVGAAIADRFVRAERLLGLCHIAAAGLMVLLSLQSQFELVLPLYLAYALVIGPTAPLTNAITFHHRRGGTHKFGNTRVWGTVGWVLVAWSFGFLWLRGSGSTAMTDRIPDALIVSAASSALLGAYAFTLPRGAMNTPKVFGGWQEIIPLGALRLFAKPQIVVLAVISLLVGVVDRFYYFGAAPFLREFGFSDGAIMPAMSLGQIVEIIAMALLAKLLRRLGIKAILLIGIIAELWRFIAFALGGSTLQILSGIACHGIAYAFFFTTVYMTIDCYCDTNSRTGLHQLFALITSGLGSLAANLLAGLCLDAYVINPTTGPDYTTFWLVPTALSTLALFAVMFLFNREPQTYRLQTKPH